MDILHLVDRLEELFNESRPIPFTHSVIVDEDRMLDLIDQMRVAIPDEVKKAQQVLSQRDRILAQAQEEANRTLSLAREKSEGLVEQSAIVEAARIRSKEIEEQAHIDAEKTRREADDYVIQTLSRLEMQLERSLTQARNGILALRHVSSTPEILTDDSPEEGEDQKINQTE
jgi:cell division septum initiation protein DivIVA